VTSTTTQFRQRAALAIEDERLQGALDTATDNFRRARDQAFAELPDAEALRDHFKALRQATLGHLAHHLETFETNARAAGAQVHWARDGTEACAAVVRIARRHGVKLAVKGKSMATEEIHLNEALEEAGVEAVETDMGDYLVQLAGEVPSHIIAPAIHKTRQQVATLLSRETGRPLPADDIPALTAAARELMRQRFLTAGMGISGGNIAVAETGSLVLVTNEGNGRMATSVPPVHVAVIGIEKVAPTWAEAAVWLALLGRSAAGQPLSVYTSVLTGPAHGDDIDGPQEMHIVLLDNGRSRLLGTPYEEVLQCIRCGACLNVCPVYREAGGHAYGSPYSGPIGAVVSPLLFGLEDYEALPHASSLCGACREVCPVRIDLPRMLIELRVDEVEQKVLSWPQRKVEKAAAFVLKNEKLMGFLSGAARLAQRPFVSGGTLKIPAPFNPAGDRRLPGLAKRSFRQLWAAGALEDER
jgi:L-lactate dehydrogenase complex protein LldF